MPRVQGAIVSARVVRYSDKDIVRLLVGWCGMSCWERNAHLHVAAVQRGFQGDMANGRAKETFLEAIVLP
jgi:hypothetical protein